MQWAAVVRAIISLDGPMGALGSEKAKCYIFEILPMSSSLFLAYFKRSEAYTLIKDHNFNLSIFN